MRAASTAWTVWGISVSWKGLAIRWAPGAPASTPVSASVRTLSSRKNGLPCVRLMRWPASG